MDRFMTCKLLICLFVGFGVSSAFSRSELPSKNQLRLLEVPKDSKILFNDTIVVSRNFGEKELHSKSYGQGYLVDCEAKCLLDESRAKLEGFTKIIRDALVNQPMSYDNGGKRHFLLNVREGFKLKVIMTPFDEGLRECPSKRNFTVADFERVCNVRVNLNKDVRVINN